jgi:GT2 family glycosyltransferase
MDNNMSHDSAGSRLTLSLVIASYNRRTHLARCIDKIRQNVSTDYELILVAGGEDGTVEWAAGQRDIRFLHEKTRQGATRAYNRGFRAAVGRYVLWLNDDSYPLPGSVEAALALFNRPDLPNLGMVAFYHNERHKWNQLDTVEHEGESFSIYNVRGVPYANFGLLPRDLLDAVGYLDEGFYFCGWDPDLSLKIQRLAGREIIGCRESLIYHSQVFDDRKQGDLARADRDNQRLFAKWRLPQKGTYPDPKSAYQRRIRDLESTARLVHHA